MLFEAFVYCLLFLSTRIFTVATLDETKFCRRSPSSLLSNLGTNIRRANSSLVPAIEHPAPDSQHLYQRLLDEPCSSEMEQAKEGTLYDPARTSTCVIDPYRRRTFPHPDYQADEEQQEWRMLHMDAPNRLVLFSRLLSDLKDVPQIDIELTAWEDDIANEGDFWEILSSQGVVPWAGIPSTIKLSQLGRTARESLLIGGNTFESFYLNFLNNHLTKWSVLHEPEYAFLQTLYNDNMKKAKGKKKSRAYPEEIRAALELPYAILHCLQLTYRNLAVEYIQTEAELENVTHGRPVKYVPHNYRKHFEPRHPQ